MALPTAETQGIPAVPTAEPKGPPPLSSSTIEAPAAQAESSGATNLPAEPAAAVTDPALQAPASGAASLPAEQPAAPVKPAAPSKPTPARPKPKTPTERWQERLLPLMRGILVGLTIFFFAVTLVQISYLHYTIQRAPEVDLGFPAGEALASQAGDFSQALAARQLDILSRLEALVIERRYHQMSVAIMSGLWLRYMGFVTGMILALVGAAFILGKLREPVSEISGKGAGVDFSLRSASPGIILVVLGVVLMMATIMDQDTYETQAKGIYLPGLPALIQTTEAEIPILGTPPAELFDDGSQPGGIDIPGTLPP